MKPPKTDFTIYGKFNFEYPPVAVKFTLNEPDGISKSNVKLALCEMIREAQKTENPFYISKDNEDCTGGIPMGWIDMPIYVESGQLGKEWGLFEEPRADAKIYQNVPRFSRGVVKYVVFSNLDALKFEPDLLFIMADVNQAEIVLRAMTYSTGQLFESKSANVLACAWLYAYPFITGKVNYTITGLSFGTKSRQTFPEGKVLITIPYNWIPVVTENLRRMEWILPAYTYGRTKFLEVCHGLHANLPKEFVNPEQ